MLIRIVPDPHPETLEDGLRQAFRNAAISDDSLDGPADAIGVAGIDVVQRVEIARTRTLDGVGEMCSFKFDDSTLAAYMNPFGEDFSTLIFARMYCGPLALVGMGPE